MKTKERASKAKNRPGRALKPSAHTQVPYLLVVGTGEAFSQSLGNTSYLFVPTARSLKSQKPCTVLIDCGYQVPERLWRKSLHLQVDTIAFTHTHADHAGGLAPLIVRYWEEKRSAALHLIGPRGLAQYYINHMDASYPGIRARLPFEVKITEITLGKSHALLETVLKSDHKLQVTGAPTRHSILNLALKFEVTFTRPPRSRHRNHIYSFCVSGDGAITPEVTKLYQGSNLVLQEVYTVSDKIPTHGSWTQVSQLLRQRPRGHIGALGAVHFQRDAAEFIRRQINQDRRKYHPTKVFIPKAGQQIRLLATLNLFN